MNGGEGGIRTHGTVASTLHFECSAFDLSATSPHMSGALRAQGPGRSKARRLAERLCLAKPLFVRIRGKLRQSPL